jgi:hypothetical protein
LEVSWCYQNTWDKIRVNFLPKLWGVAILSSKTLSGLPIGPSDMMVKLVLNATNLNGTTNASLSVSHV